MDDIGGKGANVRRRRTGQAQRETIFGPPRDRQRGDRHQITCRGKGRLGNGGGIDAGAVAPGQGMADQAVERPVRPVAYAIIVAGKQRHAQRGIADRPDGGA